jgi:putative transcriptional regulator
MDTMKKIRRIEQFKVQMARSMAELSSIISAGRSPSGDGRLTVRTIDVAEPAKYDAREVRKIRAALNVSQAIFAKLLGVSDVLVRSWERGVRQPAPIARRLLDQIRAYPNQFTGLVHPLAGGPMRVPGGRTRHRKPAA